MIKINEIEYIYTAIESFMVQRTCELYQRTVVRRGFMSESGLFISYVCDEVLTNREEYEIEARDLDKDHYFELLEAEFLEMEKNND